MIWMIDEREEACNKEWELGDYLPEECPNCKRQRLCKCDNGKSRCEKCNWCPELNQYAPVNN
jgi:hypothetical protein